MKIDAYEKIGIFEFEEFTMVSKIAHKNHFLQVYWWYIVVWH